MIQSTQHAENGKPKQSSTRASAPNRNHSQAVQTDPKHVQVSWCSRCWRGQKEFPQLPNDLIELRTICRIRVESCTEQARQQPDRVPCGRALYNTIHPNSQPERPVRADQTDWGKVWRQVASNPLTHFFNLHPALAVIHPYLASKVSVSHPWKKGWRNA